MSKQSKGMVLEIQNQMATVLTSDGQFIKTKVPKTGCVIGDEIAFEMDLSKSSVVKRFLDRLRVLNPVKSPRLNLQFAAVVLCLVGGSVSWAYPAGHVYMDVNPSLGITYNVYHRVIGVESFNEDGQAITSGLTSYGKSLEETIESTLLLMNEKGFVKDQSSAVILGFSEENANVKAEAVKAVGTAVDKSQKVIEIASVQVAKSETSQAKDIGASPIKVAIVSDQLAQDASSEAVKAQVEVLDTKTTKEIIQENEVVKKVSDARLEQIQKAIELKKQKIRELELLKKKQNNKQNNNQNQNQAQVQPSNPSADVSAPVVKKDAAAALAAQKQKLDALKKAEAALKAKANANQNQNQNQSQTSSPADQNQNLDLASTSNGEAFEVIEEDQVEKKDLSKLDQIPGETIKEKVQYLEQMRKQLIDLRAKIIKSKLAPAEKNKRVNQINKQLERVNGLLLEIKEKAKALKEQKEQKELDQKTETPNKKP